MQLNNNRFDEYSIVIFPITSIQFSPGRNASNLSINFSLQMLHMCAPKALTKKHTIIIISCGEKYILQCKMYVPFRGKSNISLKTSFELEKNVNKPKLSFSISLSLSNAGIFELEIWDFQTSSFVGFKTWSCMTVKDVSSVKKFCFIGNCRKI